MNEDLLAVEKMENKIFYNDIGIFFLHRTLDHATFIISDGTYCIHPTIAIQFQLFNFQLFVCMCGSVLLSDIAYTTHTYISIVLIY